MRRFRSNGALKVIASSMLLPLGWYAGAAQAYKLDYYNGGVWEQCLSGECIGSVNTTSGYQTVKTADLNTSAFGFTLTATFYHQDDYTADEAGRWYKITRDSSKDPKDPWVRVWADNLTLYTQTALTMGFAKTPDQDLGRVPPVDGEVFGYGNQYQSRFARKRNALKQETQVSDVTNPEDRASYPEPFASIPVSHQFKSTFSVPSSQGGAGANFSNQFFYTDNGGPEFSETWQGLFDNWEPLYIYLDFGDLDQAALTPPELFLAEAPIPGAVWLFGSALLGVWSVARRDRNKGQRGGPVV